LATGHPHQATILGALATRLHAHLAGPQQVAFSKGEHSPGTAGLDPLEKIETVDTDLEKNKFHHSNAPNLKKTSLSVF